MDLWKAAGQVRCQSGSRHRRQHGDLQCSRRSVARASSRFPTLAQAEGRKPPFLLKEERPTPNALGTTRSELPSRERDGSMVAYGLAGSNASPWLGVWRRRFQPRALESENRYLIYAGSDYFWGLSFWRAALPSTTPAWYASRSTSGGVGGAWPAKPGRLRRLNPKSALNRNTGLHPESREQSPFQIRGPPMSTNSISHENSPATYTTSPPKWPVLRAPAVAPAVSGSIPLRPPVQPPLRKHPLRGCAASGSGVAFWRGEHDA